MSFLIDTLRHWLSLTAWEMEIPPSYGVFHILVMVGGFSLCGVLAWLLRRAGDRANRAILLGIGTFLLLSEIYKQLFYIWVAEPGQGYRWGIFPFQLCSIPLYFCLIASLLRPGRVQKGMYNFLMLYNLLGGFIAFFEPSGLFHGHVTLTAHALVWHMMLVFLGFYLFLSGRGGLDRQDYRSATYTFLGLCVVAFGINCAFWEISDHQIKMFFLGPGNSPIIVFKQIAETFGWVVCTAIYIPVVCLGAYLLLLLFRLIRRRLSPAITPEPTLSSAR